MGALVSRSIRSEADYLLAGRRLGPVMASASVFATWFGAETCVGAAGQVYERGLSAPLSDPFGYGLCLLLFGLFFASPLYQRGITTLADFFRERFSQGVERSVAVLLIPGSVLWAAAQMRAFGQVLAEGTGLGLVHATALAALSAVVYTAFGGLLADAYTDLFQGGMLVLCLLVLAVVVIGDLGGLSSVIPLVNAARRDANAEELSWVEHLDGWAVPILGSLFAQELASRVVASRSAQVARRATLTAAAAYLGIGVVTVLLGLVARSTLPGRQGEAILATLARQHLGELGHLLFAGALVSAILSTVDSALLVSGSLISHNLVPVVRPNLTDAARVRVARASVCALGALACGLSLGADSVHGLVEEASSFGSAGICVAGGLGLFTRRGKASAAYASLLAGALAWAAAAYLVDAPGAFLVSLLAAALAYGASALLFGLRKREVAE